MRKIMAGHLLKRNSNAFGDVKLVNITDSGI